jgi:hypothetical protein
MYHHSYEAVVSVGGDQEREPVVVQCGERERERERVRDLKQGKR